MEKVAGRLSSPLGNTILLWVSVGDGKNPLGPDSLGLLGRAEIPDFANELADLSKCSSYRLRFSRFWVEILITVSIVALLVFM